jgi:hypothetical protein
MSVACVVLDTIASERWEQMVRAGATMLAFDGLVAVGTVGGSLAFPSAFGALDPQDAPRPTGLSMTCGERTQPSAQHPDAATAATNVYAVQSPVTVLERP